jgi:daunorubicin resistance ABC transporter ATP-binding subunit
LISIKDRADAGSMTNDAIFAEGLHKRFGEVRALDGLDLAVPAASVLGLLGPNGAGKTTAVRILTTVIRPDAGHARVLGHDVVAQADAVRASIGLAGQYAAVDENLTGRENLILVGWLTNLGRRTAKARAGELLERFGLSEAADRPTKTYSGGMRRRLDLASALVHRPPVLFLDEPTTGLDPPGRLELWEVISELVSEGTTLLLTTQYLEEADRLADQVVVVDHGRVIAQGTPTELKAGMGATVLEIGLADEATAIRVAELVAATTAGALRRSGTTVELTVEDKAATVVDVMRRLDQAGLEPAALALREPTLDDVFLSLTGHKATNGEAAKAAEAGRKMRGAA